MGGSGEHRAKDPGGYPISIPVLELNRTAMDWHPAANAVRLTRRQREVVDLIVQGLTNREIARQLFISERTADGHLEQIRNKIGVSSRAQIAAWAVQQKPAPAGNRLAARVVDAPLREIEDKGSMLRVLCPVMVGREKELTYVEDALLAAVRGEGRLVLLAGDAGMGKTRLARELGGRAHKMGIAVVSGSCSEAELSLPYLPFVEALGNYVARADLVMLRERLGPAAGELGHLFPRLERGLVDTSEPGQAKLRLFEAMLQLMELVAGERGMLLILEDLHWADASTRQQLDYMARRLRSARVLVLGSYRSDEMYRKHPLMPTLQGWKRVGLAQTLELTALDAHGVGQMVEAIFDDPIQADTRDFLHQRCAGNPFVVEELLKEALDRGDIYRTEAGWERKELSEFGLPETVRDTILLRLERLPQAQLELLRGAAVLGQIFEDRTLLALFGQEQTAVRAALEAMVQQQLLEPVTGRRYRFRHALTQEAVYEDLIATEKERLHLRAAEALEGQGGRPVDIAQHLFMAGEPERALPMALQAAAEAEVSYAYMEAAGLYERALPGVREPEPKARLLWWLGRSLGRGESYEHAERYLREAIAALEASGQAADAARARVDLAHVLWYRGRADLIIDELARSIAVLEPLEPSEELARAHALQAFQIVANAGDLRLAIGLAEKGMSIAESAGSAVARLQAANYYALAHLQLGDDDDEALALLLRTGTEAASLGLVVPATSCFNNYALMLPPERLPEAFDALEAIRKLAPHNERTARLEVVLRVLSGQPALQQQAAETLLGLASGEEALHLGRAFLSVALTQQGDLPAALSTLPLENPSLDLQERAARSWGAMLLAWAHDDLERASDLAVGMLVHLLPWLPVWAVPIALEAGVVAEVEAALAAFSQGKSKATALSGLRGQVAVATGYFETAIRLLEPVAELESEAGEALTSSFARLALAEARAGLGDGRGARRELETLRDSAVRRDHWFHQELVRRKAARLGVALAGAGASDRS